MTDNFEQRKNIKAGTITLAILGLLMLLVFIISWTTPALPQPPVEEGLEVNLGNSDAGFGKDQPFEPGEPAPKEQQHYTPPPKATAAPDEPAKDITTNDKDAEAPEIKKPLVTKPEATKIPEKEVAKKVIKHPAPPTPPVPSPPRPKAVFKGVNGTGTGGNEADSYKKGGNEGIAGGRGDQGRPGGDPNSKNYEGGGHGSSGVSIARGLEGRRLTSLPSFQDDFNENAKVAVDIRVDETGKVVSAVYQPRGSTTASTSMKSIAIRKALQIKFNTAGEESVGTLIFNFKLRN